MLVIQNIVISYSVVRSSSNAMYRSMVETSSLKIKGQYVLSWPCRPTVITGCDCWVYWRCSPIDRCLHVLAPKYPSKQLQGVSDISTRMQRLWSSSTTAQVISQLVLPAAIDHSLLSRPLTGTACRKRSVLLHRCRCSEICWSLHAIIHARTKPRTDSLFRPIFIDPSLEVMQR